ncbi:hypothetical protein IE53DRAFT_359902 [Violaceomyces palustris]|uniref:Uncharacterized protein n=1 Tax=Violaceomyces palustris TaxID=1673888 RepID=A0ACD0P669_9BASI|nr:hypothetical protein IE53DRAFT_359902 [Violaceomyces palustris]
MNSHLASGTGFGNRFWGISDADASSSSSTGTAVTSAMDHYNPNDVPQNDPKFTHHRRVLNSVSLIMILLGCLVLVMLCILLGRMLAVQKRQKDSSNMVKRWSNLLRARGRVRMDSCTDLDLERGRGLGLEHCYPGEAQSQVLMRHHRRGSSGFSSREIKTVVPASWMYDQSQTYSCKVGPSGDFMGGSRSYNVPRPPSSSLARSSVSHSQFSMSPPVSPTRRLNALPHQRCHSQKSSGGSFTFIPVVPTSSALGEIGGGVVGVEMGRMVPLPKEPRQSLASPRQRSQVLAQQNYPSGSGNGLPSSSSSYIPLSGRTLTAHVFEQEQEAYLNRAKLEECHQKFAHSNHSYGQQDWNRGPDAEIFGKFDHYDHAHRSGEPKVCGTMRKALREDTSFFLLSNTDHWTHEEKGIFLGSSTLRVDGEVAGTLVDNPRYGVDMERKGSQSPSTFSVPRSVSRAGSNFTFEEDEDLRVQGGEETEGFDFSRRHGHHDSTLLSSSQHQVKDCQTQPPRGKVEVEGPVGLGSEDGIEETDGLGLIDDDVIRGVTCSARQGSGLRRDSSSGSRATASPSSRSADESSNLMIPCRSASRKLTEGRRYLEPQGPKGKPGSESTVDEELGSAFRDVFMLDLGNGKGLKMTPSPLVEKVNPFNRGQPSRSDWL